MPDCFYSLVWCVAWLAYLPPLGLQLRGHSDCSSVLDSIVLNGQKGFLFFLGVLMYTVVLDSHQPSLLHANDFAGGVVSKKVCHLRKNQHSALTSLV